MLRCVTDQVRAGQRPLPMFEPRTRALLKAVATLLRSVSPEDGETDILLHDMARQIEARLNAAVVGTPAEPGQQGGSATRLLPRR